jgi:signal transduction histidine kinase
LTRRRTSSPRFTSPGRSGALLVVGMVVCIEGLAAARIGFPSYAFATAVLTVLTGWTIAASGLVVWRHVPSSRIGTWLVLAGAAFFADAFGRLAWHPAATVAGQLTWLSVGLIGGALLTMPDGRTHTRAGSATVGAFIVAAIVIPPDRGLLVGGALGAAMLLRRVVESPDHRQGPADITGLLLIVVLAARATAGTLESVPAFDTYAFYAAAIAATAMVIAAEVITTTPTLTRVADAVLRVDPAVPLSIERELRRSTGQPFLRVTFPLAAGSGYVDATGAPIDLPRPGSGRVATPIVSTNGHVEAMVIHDRRLDTEIAIDPGIARAGALSAANARLQAELRRQVADVRASRRRLLEAEQIERRRLRERLAAALLPALAEIETGLASLDEGRAHEDMDPEITQPPDAATIIATVRELRGELDAVTAGLHPASVGERGLDGAIRRAVARSPFITTVTTAGLDRALDLDVAATAWYVCSEALANVAKHARARHVSVQVDVRDDRLRMVVQDDGIGGADPSAGTGLRGLRDRLETMGGTLRIEPVAGGGTRVLADLPAGVA